MRMRRRMAATISGGIGTIAVAGAGLDVEGVKSGAYASSSAVVRDALHLWELRAQFRQLEIARLKRAYDEGMASGEGREVDAKTLLAELKAEARSFGKIYPQPQGRAGLEGYLAGDRAGQ